MDLISHLTLLGGVSDRATLVSICGRSELDRSVRLGLLVRDARGRYALPTALEAVRTANSFAGVASHRSAAQAWGWAQKSVPLLPEVTFRRNRRLPPETRRTALPRWGDLAPGDVTGGRTTVRRTLFDCMRALPFDEALAIADSALRADDVRPAELRAIADSVRGSGRATALRVAELATSKAANPFESVLRAIAQEVRGIDLQPQHPVRINSRRVIHPDLADPALAIAVEAEGFEWHGNKSALTRDCVRYNALTLAGWTVVRFSWVLVMRQPRYVASTLGQLAAVKHAGCCCRPIGGA